MKTMIQMKRIGIACALTAVMALSGMALAGCGGGSSSSSSDSSTSSSSTSSSSTSSSSSASEESSSSEDISLTDLEAAMSEAYMGMTDSGEGFYYAASADGALAIVMVANTNGETVSFVGPAEANGSHVTVTDIANELSLTFEVQPQSDGTILLDLGDLGAALVAPCEVSEVLEVMEALDTYGTAVA